MAQNRSFGLPLAMLLLAGLSSVAAQSTPPGAAGAQANPVISRLAGNWHSSPLVILRGSKPPVSINAIDQGVAPANQSLGRMILLLAPSVAQQQALAAHLAAVQDPSSPLYHQWQSASSFADAYSVSAADAAAVLAWLSAQGFQVAALPAGRGWVEFTGTVAQVEQAFQAQIHTFTSVSGETRAALVGDISVPAALQPVIAGLVSLDGAISTPALTAPQPLSISAADLATANSSGAPALTPQLEAQILNLQPLTAAGVTGSGQSIAIASRSNINTVDVTAFRAAFGLPASPLTVTLDGPDPGLTAAQADATLAASWAGAAAPGAQIILVPAASTSATDGVDLSLAAIVDQQLAATALVGYSSCEAGLSAAHQAFYSALYSQAAAEGIAVIAAAGDSGASACSLPGSTTPITTGYGVNALASTPWNTAVGVAAFGPSGPAAGTLAAWSPSAHADPAYAGGGGSSALYATPAWQSLPPQFQPGASTSLPTRLLPDLSLPTAIDSATSPGLAFCLSASTSASQSCTLVRSGGSAASASIFAGVAALVLQQYGAQGNLAPHLYALSAHSGVFTDVAQGSAQLPCAAGAPGCGAAGKIGYTAQSGYDLATGLGVPNAHALVTNWATPLVNGTGASNVGLTISPSEPGSVYNPAALITFTATVTSGTGGPVPTQTVTFLDQSNGQNLGTATLNGSGMAAVAVEGDFAIGGNNIIAEYSGDPVYAAQNSAPSTFTTQASSTSLSVSPSATAVSPGQTISVTVTMTIGTPPAPGITPSGVITLNLDGSSVGTQPLTGSGSTFTATFPTVTIPTATATTHTLQATYPANADFATSTSTGVTLTVSKVTTTLTITPASFTPAGNGSLNVTATINPAVYESANPTGTVQFTLDGANIGSDGITPGNPSTATFNIPNITPGSHTLGGSYNGDTNYAGSTAQTVTINATKAATVTTLAASPSPLASATPESFTATVAPANAVTGTTYTLTGTVSFYDGATLLGSATLNANSATISGITLSATQAHTIKAVYSGDTNWLASSSNTLTLEATTLLDTVVLTANYTTAPPGVAIILTATVTPAVPPLPTAEQNPTGTVVFLFGNTVIGAAPLIPLANSDASTATLITQTLPGGSDTLSASYSGDAIYAAELSAPLNIIVQNFVITPCSSNPLTNLNIVQGGAGSECFNISGEGGFNSTLQIICTVPAQDDMTCTASPQQINPPDVVTFVVQTSTANTIVKKEAAPPLWPQALGGTALAALFFFLVPFGRRARAFSRSTLVLLVLLAGLAATGIGCTSTGATASFGTPLGVATIKITASAYIDDTVVSQSTYFTVNVTAK